MNVPTRSVPVDSPQSEGSSDPKLNGEAAAWQNAARDDNLPQLQAVFDDERSRMRVAVVARSPRMMRRR